MFRMLQKKSFKDITVQTILDECQISRATFYNYYKDKYDLMSCCYEFYIDEILATYKGKNWEERLLLIFQFNKANGQFMKNAFKITGDNSFLDCLHHHAFRVYREEYLEKTGAKALTQKECMMLDFFCAGLCYTMKKWSDNGLKESATEMAQLVFDLVPEVFRQHLVDKR